MSIELNHTIVHARDNRESANFLTELFDLPRPEPFYHFLVVRTHNGVSLDFISTDDPIVPQHYAFLVGEKDFDDIFDRIRARRIKFWADPATTREGQINTHYGGRGLYFKDPGGNILEIITRPYAKENS